jgi:hypothetical protein
MSNGGDAEQFSIPFSYLFDGDDGLCSNKVVRLFSSLVLIKRRAIAPCFQSPNR